VVTAADYALAFAVGVAGSLHCVGMCGGFVLGVAAAPGRSAAGPGARLLDQVLFHGGKLFTYAFLGAMGGMAGVAIRSFVPVVRAQEALALLSGALLVATGLHLIGAWPRVSRLLPRGRGSGEGGLVALRASPPGGAFKATFVTLLSRFTRSAGRAAPFFAGLFVGFIPCALVYAAAAKAAQTASVGAGAGIMVAFGLGTAPALLAVALGGALVPARLRGRLAVVAATMAIALGGLTVMRGVSSLRAPVATAEAAAPAVECH